MLYKHTFAKVVVRKLSERTIGIYKSWTVHQFLYSIVLKRKQYTLHYTIFFFVEVHYNEKGNQTEMKLFYANKKCFLVGVFINTYNTVLFCKFCNYGSALLHCKDRAIIWFFKKCCSYKLVANLFNFKTKSLLFLVLHYIESCSCGKQWNISIAALGDFFVGFLNYTRKGLHYLQANT